MKTLNVFPRERTIVMRERGKKAYDVLPYFGSKCALGMDLGLLLPPVFAKLYNSACKIALYEARRLIAELPVGALFPLLFGSLVYPMTGLNASAKRCEALRQLLAPFLHVFHAVLR